MPMAEYLEYSITYFTKGEAGRGSGVAQDPSGSRRQRLNCSRVRRRTSMAPLGTNRTSKRSDSGTRPEDSIEWSIDVATRGEYDVDVERHARLAMRVQR